jgi:hypothetical protein
MLSSVFTVQLFRLALSGSSYRITDAEGDFSVP